MVLILSTEVWEVLQKKCSGLVSLPQRYLAGKTLVQQCTAAGNWAGQIANLEITPLTIFNKQTLSPYLGKDDSGAEKMKNVETDQHDKKQSLLLWREQLTGTPVWVQEITGQTSITTSFKILLMTKDHHLVLFIWWIMQWQAAEISNPIIRWKLFWSGQQTHTSWCPWRDSLTLLFHKLIVAGCFSILCFTFHHYR